MKIYRALYKGIVAAFLASSCSAAVPHSSSERLASQCEAVLLEGYVKITSTVWAPPPIHLRFGLVEEFESLLSAQHYPPTSSNFLHRGLMSWIRAIKSSEITTRLGPYLDEILKDSDLLLAFARFPDHERVGPESCTFLYSGRPDFLVGQTNRAKTPPILSLHNVLFAPVPPEDSASALVEWMPGLLNGIASEVVLRMVRDLHAQLDSAAQSRDGYGLGIVIPGTHDSPPTRLSWKTARGYEVDFSELRFMSVGLGHFLGMVWEVVARLAPPTTLSTLANVPAAHEAMRTLTLDGPSSASVIQRYKLTSRNVLERALIHVMALREAIDLLK